MDSGVAGCFVNGVGIAMYVVPCSKCRLASVWFGHDLYCLNPC